MSHDSAENWDTLLSADLHARDADRGSRTQIGQLFKIFEILGTPSETTWQGVEGMPCWQAQFPQWNARDLAEVGTPGMPIRSHGLRSSRAAKILAIIL